MNVVRLYHVESDNAFKWDYSGFNI
jgi:hypothetical protein